jgi:hypothetical protein
MADAAALFGSVRLRVAAGLPAIDSPRAALAPRLAPGRPTAAWPDLVGRLFTLCGSAHQFCAERAIAAARGDRSPATPLQRERLRQATLRDQLQRIVHDWPRQLPRQPRHDPQHTARQLHGWRAEQWLGEPAAHWLQRHLQDPHDGIAAWVRCPSSTGPLAALLRPLLALQLDTLAVPDVALRLREHDLPALAAAMTTPGFCLQPHWQGQARSTGPWSRHADAPPPATAWHLLLSRVVDLLQLAAPAGAHRLWHGALPLAEGEGLAWCEMARGLLVHHVRLAPDHEHLASSHVLAPTEWNCHPRGALAQALARLDAHRPADELQDTARALAVAFDPCVDFTLQLPDTPATIEAVRGPCHA